MSDETPAAVPSPDAAPARPAPVVARPTAEEDSGWIRHLGLPFFYRHRPPLWALRIGFYSGLVLVLGLIAYELIVVPLAYGRSREKDLLATLFTMAIVLSCICAPLLSTFSLCSERVTGTMEFLKLAPISPTGILMGKTFGPVLHLHAGSLLLMLVGCALGVALSGWMALGSKLCAAAVLILLHAVLLQALGALLASLTVFMRGLAPQIGLLGLGLLLQLVPQAARYEPRMRVLGYFSPWGALNEALGMGYRRWSDTPAMIFNCADWGVPFAVLSYLLLIVLLFRAAARRLDSPVRTALSPLGYLVVWAFLTTLCAGIGLNEFRWGRSALGWGEAAVLLVFGGATLLFLMILDHPHRRETLLARMCECTQRGEPIPGSGRHLGHAGLVVVLALLAPSLLIGLLALAMPLRACDAGWAALAIVLPPLLAFILCLLVEANQIGLRGPLPRIGLFVGGCALLAGLVLGAVIDVTYTFSVWSECIQLAQAGTAARNQNAYYERRLAECKAGYPERFAHLATAERIEETRTALSGSPVCFFARHHPVRALLYPGLLCLALSAVIVWRQYAYRALRLEAERACQRV